MVFLSNWSWWRCHVTSAGSCAHECWVSGNGARRRPARWDTCRSVGTMQIQMYLTSHMTPRPQDCLLGSSLAVYLLLVADHGTGGSHLGHEMTPDPPPFSKWRPGDTVEGSTSLVVGPKSSSVWIKASAQWHVTLIGLPFQLFQSRPVLSHWWGTYFLTRNTGSIQYLSSNWKKTKMLPENSSEWSSRPFIYINNQYHIQRLTKYVLRILCVNIGLIIILGGIVGARWVTSVMLG